MFLKCCSCETIEIPLKSESVPSCWCAGRGMAWKWNAQQRTCCDRWRGKIFNRNKLCRGSCQIIFHSFLGVSANTSKFKSEKCLVARKLLGLRITTQNRLLDITIMSSTARKRELPCGRWAWKPNSSGSQHYQDRESTRSGNSLETENLSLAEQSFRGSWITQVRHTPNPAGFYLLTFSLTSACSSSPAPTYNAVSVNVFKPHRAPQFTIGLKPKPSKIDNNPGPSVDPTPISVYKPRTPALLIGQKLKRTKLDQTPASNAYLADVAKMKVMKRSPEHTIGINTNLINRAKTPGPADYNLINYNPFSRDAAYTMRIKHTECSHNMILACDDCWKTKSISALKSNFSTQTWLEPSND